MFSLWRALINSSMFKEASHSESVFNPSGAINKTDIDIWQSEYRSVW